MALYSRDVNHALAQRSDSRVPECQRCNVKSQLESGVMTPVDGFMDCPLWSSVSGRVLTGSRDGFLFSVPQGERDGEGLGQVLRGFLER